MHSERGAPFTLCLPYRPAALPMAQRLATWGRLAGVSVRIVLAESLAEIPAPAVALGDFPGLDAWRGDGKEFLDPLDWPALSRWARTAWPLPAFPRTRFSADAPLTLPGEEWTAPDGPGLDLELAPPEWALLQAARARGLSLSTAESCTAGGVAVRLAALPGSSSVLFAGHVVYSNLAKEKMLGVRPRTLQQHGAVSEPVVAEMLAGALCHSDLAIAISGIAGPGGAVPGKPVGTVCLGWGFRDQAREVRTLHFPGDRWAVQQGAGTMVLGGLLGLLAPDGHIPGIPAHPHGR